MNHLHPSPNGVYKAPQATSGAFPLPQPQTRFPEEYEQTSWRTLLYHLSRVEILDISVFRILLFLLLVIGLLAGLSQVWSLALLGLLGALGLWLTVRRLRHRYFVHFVATDLPVVRPQKLEPSQKVPLYVSGELFVEGKRQSFAYLPGFYRTFATREHALLCRVTPRRFLRVAAWPEVEIGLWYLFFRPEAIQRIRAGSLYFGNTSQPALAVDYISEAVATKRRKALPVQLTFYLALPQHEDSQIILADLLFERPELAASPAPNSLPQVG